MKKRKLEAEFEYDFSLFGLISALKEYKLAWLINRHLDVQLNKAMDIKIDFLKSQDLVISNYLYETENSSFRLLKNKSMEQFGDNSAFLLPELNRFDYLVVIRGFDDTYLPNEIKKKLAAISNIQYVQHFEVEKLKSKENLIF